MSGHWWSSTENSKASSAKSKVISSDGTVLNYNDGLIRDLSVRCLKDN